MGKGRGIGKRNRTVKGGKSVMGYVCMGREQVEEKEESGWLEKRRDREMVWGERDGRDERKIRRNTEKELEEKR